MCFLPTSAVRRQSGFALLVTIVLVAFLVLILIGLATFTRVETQVADNTASVAKARQNALTGLNIALGELQKHAGPDARVTARADILESDSATYATNPNWSGVWDTNNNNKLPRTWLVSGNEQSAINSPARVPTVNLTRNTFQNTDILVSVVSTVSAGAAGGVVVPKVELKSDAVPGLSGDNIIGRYAWWAGDEGIKARVNLREESAAMAAYEPRADIRAVARQESPRQTPIATAIVGASNSDAQLDRVVMDAQLALLAGVASADARDRFHDVSVSSLGVLVNTESAASSGLKQDLSITPTLVSAEFSNVVDYASYMLPPVADYTRVYRMRPPTVTTSGAIMDGVAPALTEFILQFYITGTMGSNNLSLRVQGLYELFNPYTSELAMEPLQLIVEGLPTVEVRSSSGGATPAAVDLDAILRGSQSRLVINLPNGSSLADPNLFQFLPGRVLSWGGLAAPGGTVGTPSPSVVSTPNQRTASASQRDYTTGVGTLPAPLAAGDTLSLSSTGSTTLTVTLVRASDGDVLATYRSPDFQALIKASYAFNSLTNPFAYRFRLKDRSNYVVPGDWLEEIDPRHPAPPQAYFFTATPQPGSAPATGSAAINDATQLFNRSASTAGTSDSIRHVQDTALFELPRAPYTNVASLQNLGRIDGRPYALGNTWGGALNSYFDNYYMSGTTTVNPSLGANPQRFRNQRLRFYADDNAAPPSLAIFRAVPNSRSSRYVLVEGQFNLNSTSVEAWKTILATTTVPSWDFVNPGDYGAQDSATPTASAALDGVFLRFPQSAQETYDIDQIGGGGGEIALAPTQRRHYRRGVIRLSSADRDELAARIVRNIKLVAAADGPFRTVKAFLDTHAALGGESVLSEAIAHVATTANTWVRTERAFTELSLTDPIDANAPSYLLQSDILSSVAAAISPRSDTFIVRVYGEAVNPVTQVRESSAWLEATVQRIPDFVDAANDAAVDYSSLNTNNQAFGRKFKITQIRWLSATDI